MAPETGGSAIDQASMDLARGVGAGHGVALVQDKVGVTSFRPAKSAAERNIARVKMDDVTPEKLAEIEAALAGTDSFPLHTPDGLEIAYGGDVDMPGAKFTKDMKDVFGKDVEFGRNSGGLVGNTNWDSPGYKPSEWMREIDEANLGPAEARLERGTVDLARGMDEADALLEAEIPDAGRRSEILTKTRKILMKDGFEGVRRAVAAGTIPAIMLTVIGAEPGADSGNI